MNTIDVDFKKIFESLPGYYLLLEPDINFTIIGATDAYLKLTSRKRDAIVGKSVFEVFPDNPNDPNASGVANLSASFHKALEEKLPNQMPLQKYDVNIPHSESYEERFWKIVNIPVLDETQAVRWIINSVSEVTQFVNR